MHPHSCSVALYACRFQWSGPRYIGPLAPRRLHSSLCFPGARRLSSSSVDVQDNLPDLIFREEILPHRHGRVPRVGLGWQAWTSLGDAPEDIRLLQLGDRANVHEVRRRRDEAVSEMARAVQIVAVAGETILKVDGFPLIGILWQLVGLFAQRIFQADEVEGFAAHGDLPRRGGMNGPQLGG